MIWFTFWKGTGLQVAIAFLHLRPVTLCFWRWFDHDFSRLTGRRCIFAFATCHFVFLEVIRPWFLKVDRSLLHFCNGDLSLCVFGGDSTMVSQGWQVAFGTLEFSSPIYLSFSFSFFSIFFLKKKSSDWNRTHDPHLWKACWGNQLNYNDFLSRSDFIWQLFSEKFRKFRKKGWNCQIKSNFNDKWR